MPLADRDYMRGEHPPSCTCKDCNDKRLAMLNDGQGNRSHHKTRHTATGSYNPKRYSPGNRWAKRTAMSLLKFLLCLLIIGMIWLVLINVYSLTFDGSFYPMGLVIVLAELGVTIGLILLAKSRRFRWRFPSFKLVLFPLLGIIIILAFIGIVPFEGIKSNIVDEVAPPVQVVTPEVPAVTTITPVTPPLQSVDSYVGIFNQYRQGNGLEPLVFTDDLNRIAVLRLAEIQKDFSHASAGGHNRHLGENIAMSTGYLSNAEALKMWENSPGHNANMLDSDYKYTGYALENGYAVQVFASYPTINGEPQLPDGWYWVD